MQLDLKYLDYQLIKCLSLVIDNFKINKVGLVGACILTENNPAIYGVSLDDNGKWYHAERIALMRYKNTYGDLPDNAIMITTLSPCFNPMKDRYKNSCTDLIEKTPIKTVYTALIDITETKQHKNFYDNCTYNIIVSDNKRISYIAKGLLQLIAQRLNEK